MRDTHTHKERDKELWQLFINGDDNAFARLYELYVGSMLYYGLHFTQLRDLVEDAIQDVFVYIYSNRTSLKQMENVKVYLYVSLKNRLFALFDKDSKYYHIDSIEPVFFVESSVEDDYIDLETDRELKEHIRQMLQLLSPRQREVVYYRFVEGMSCDEICVLMQINSQSVRNLIYRSVSKIRETFLNYKNKMITNCYS
jgi:RNA polymerase sigma factor (sigma-70 family)